MAESPNRRVTRGNAAAAFLQRRAPLLELCERHTFPVEMRHQLDASESAASARAFEAMMEMQKIDVGKIEAAVRGET